MSHFIRNFGFALSLGMFGCAHAPQAKDLSVRIDQTLIKVCSMASNRDPLFDFNSTQLTPGAQQSLDTLAYCLTNGPMAERTLQLTGRTDPIGSEESNRDLGFERADSVARYLELKGVKRSHLVVMSKGEDGASPDPKRWRSERIVDLKVID
ncbi:MAG: OmpA family protein [Archangium sp.]